MDVKLVMFKANGSRKEFPVASSTSILGRSEDCDIRVPILSVSRHHCEITIYEDGVGVKDLGSSNGTFVNGTRVNEAGVEAGDLLAIGPIGFVVQIDGVPADITPEMIRPGVRQQGDAAENSADELEAIELDASDVQASPSSAEGDDFPFAEESDLSAAAPAEEPVQLQEEADEDITFIDDDEPSPSGGESDPIAALEMMVDEEEQGRKKHKNA